MIGYTFYADYGSKRAKRKGGDAPNAIAVFGEVFADGLRECVVGLTNELNAPVCGSSASLDYIRESCKCVSEAEARRIHPILFERLDADIGD